MAATKTWRVLSISPAGANCHSRDSDRANVDLERISIGAF